MMKRVEMKRNRKSNPGGGACMHIGMHVSEDSNKLQVEGNRSRHGLGDRSGMMTHHL